MAFSIDELVPQESSFKLSGFPDKEFKLKKFTLRDEAWLAVAFGKGTKMHDVLIKRDTLIIAQIAYHLLIDKTDFKTFDDFLEAIVTGKDKEVMVLSVLDTYGFSQPVITKLQEEQLERERKEVEKNPNEQAPPP